ncbi:PadR family transcriptional regulator [Streptomyces nojiriensis]|uniref:PadR family transcriptional regulator n=1 Tax=Streptomyces nojiriensis TaxID=66374 RepID=UPI002E177758
MNIKMTAATMRVLRTLLEEPTAPHYGRQLMEATKLQSGSLYPILARLEREGVIAGEQEDIDPKEAGRPARRYYKITGEGARAARQALAEVHELSRVPQGPWHSGIAPEGT